MSIRVIGTWVILFTLLISVGLKGSERDDVDDSDVVSFLKQRFFGMGSELASDKDKAEDIVKKSKIEYFVEVPNHRIYKSYKDVDRFRVIDRQLKSFNSAPK